MNFSITTRPSRPPTPTEVTAQTRSFIDSVERVSLLITDRLKSGALHLRGWGGQNLLRHLHRQGERRIHRRHRRGQRRNRLQQPLLLDALRNTDGDEVKIQLNGALSPMKVLPRRGDSFLFLVLPVRLKNEG